MSSFSVQSPTRVDLAGGTLDMWPLYNFVGGEAKTINVAIDIWTRATLQARTDQKIVLSSKDTGLNLEFSSAESFLKDSSANVAFYQIVHRYFNPEMGYELSTSSESPIGGGLGGSSSLMISMLKVYSQWLGIRWESPEKMVFVAHNLESQLLTTPTGTQDYFPAVTGGLNLIHYSTSGMRQSILEVDDEFQKRWLLVYSGRSHHSGLNNFEVLTNSVQKKSETLDSLQSLRQISEEVEKVCLARKWDDLARLFQAEFKQRLRLAKAFSSPEIEKLAEIALQAGSQAVKICGAGGGGCVLLWNSPSSLEKVKQACQKAGFQILAAKPVGKLSNQTLFTGL